MFPDRFLCHMFLDGFLDLSMQDIRKHCNCVLVSHLQQNPINLFSYKVRTQKQKNVNGSGAQTKKTRSTVT